jgi:aminoglycoside phosphotransferase (APT) family kinase protein
MAGGKMHDDEVDTDVSLVRRLLTAQFPQWAELPIQPVKSAGTDNALYRLGDDKVVRLPRIAWAIEQVDKEHRWLPKLAPLLPLAIPSPLAKGTPGEGYPWHWSIYRWLNGENATIEHIADPVQLATKLAHFITVLQQIDLTGGPLSNRGVPLAMRDKAARQAIASLNGMIDTEAATTAWEAALHSPVWHGSPVWIHGDLQSGNLLAQKGRLRAVIDFGCLGVGDPACDLQVAWNLFSAETRTIFRTLLQIDDATWARGRGWALSVGLIALPYYQNSNPVLANISRWAINEVLAGHRREA